MNDELSKLFEEAGQAVKKASGKAPAPPPPPPEPKLEETPAAPPPPPPVAAPPPSTGPLQLKGGEQQPDALVALAADGSSRTIPYASVQALSLARVGESQVLAFLSGGSLYYFQDNAVTYKGLLRQMQASTAMNWRGLITELASQVPDAQKTDPGVTAVAGGTGGMLPRYPDLKSFLAKLGV
ncbi:MAG: hypothetical protein ACYCW6_19040 [Candidatus Xenobia bacterium]